MACKISAEIASYDSCKNVKMNPIKIYPNYANILSEKNYLTIVTDDNYKIVIDVEDLLEALSEFRLLNLQDE